MNEFCTVLDPVLVIYSKTSRNPSRYLWDPSAYFDCVVMFGFVLVVFSFFKGVVD